MFLFYKYVVKDWKHTGFWLSFLPLCISIAKELYLIVYI